MSSRWSATANSRSSPGAWMSTWTGSGPSALRQEADGPAAKSPPSAAEERTARKDLQRLERQLERLSTRETKLAAELAANATDYEKLTALGTDLRATQAEKADLEERWLTVAAELDA